MNKRKIRRRKHSLLELTTHETIILKLIQLLKIKEMKTLSSFYSSGSLTSSWGYLQHLEYSRYSILVIYPNIKYFFIFLPLDPHLTSLIINLELHFTLRDFMPIPLARCSPMTKASYSTLLLVAWNVMTIV